MKRLNPNCHLSSKLQGLSIALACLVASTMVQAARDGVSEADELEMVARYEAAMAKGNETAALKYVLDYTEKAYGDNAPQTIKVTHRYGSSLYQDGDFQKATTVLKKALKRSTAAFGPYGGEAFEINMNIAYAYSEWSPSLLSRMKYFDGALEVLRERGERESITYVSTLVSIVVNLMDNNGLTGWYRSYLSDMNSPEAAEITLPIEREYRNNFDKAEKYLLEAIEIGKELENQDVYISAKIAIAQAKLNVLETADLAAVPMGVEGRPWPAERREGRLPMAARHSTWLDVPGAIGSGLSATMQIEMGCE